MALKIGFCLTLILVGLIALTSTDQPASDPHHQKVSHLGCGIDETDFDGQFVQTKTDSTDLDRWHRLLKTMHKLGIVHCTLQPWLDCKLVISDYI